MADTNQKMSMDMPGMTHGGAGWWSLALVFAVIVAAAVAIILGGWGESSHFNTPTLYGTAVMGMFFLVFGLFKAVTLRDFAAGYQSYDLIAGRAPVWGYLYPFIELALGLALFVGPAPIVLPITAVLSLEAAASVAIKLARRERFTCVCLGTIFNIPLTYVSLAEYTVMFAMAVAMLVL